MNTEKLDRKKRYYQKHRNRILKSLKDKRLPRKHEPFASRLLQAFSQLMASPEKLLLSFLILSCTAYLVVESARTLAAIEGAGAFAKALLCEVVLVGVSMLTVTTRRMQILRSAVLVGIAALSLLSTVGGPLTSYAQARQSVTSQAEEISILGRVIEQKQTLLTRYLASHRISGARRLELEITSLSDRLTRCKRELSAQHSEFTLALGFAITVLLRLVIMAANIVFSNQFGKLLQWQNFAAQRDPIVKRPKLCLVRT